MNNNQYLSMKGGKRDGAGRPLGAKNKTQEEIRECFQQLICENLNQLSNDLKSLKPEQRIKFIIELSKFVIPHLKAIENVNINDPEFNTVVIRYLDGVKPA